MRDRHLRRREIIAYVAGLSSPTEDARVEHHAGECMSCGARLAQEARVEMRLYEAGHEPTRRALGCGASARVDGRRGMVDHVAGVLAVAVSLVVVPVVTQGVSASAGGLSGSPISPGSSIEVLQHKTCELDKPESSDGPIVSLAWSGEPGSLDRRFFAAASPILECRATANASGIGGER